MIAELLTVALIALTPVEGSMIDNINADRAVAGLPALSLDYSLVEQARQRATTQLRGSDTHDMAALSHDGWVRSFDKSGCTEEGENLARGPLPIATALAAEQALLASPTHRANVLSPRYTKLAVGVVDSAGSRAFTQLFCGD